MIVAVAGDRVAFQHFRPKCHRAFEGGDRVVMMVVERDRGQDRQAEPRAFRIDQRDLLRRLAELQYTRNEMDFRRATYRVRGDVIDIFPAESERDALRERWEELRTRLRAGDDDAPLMAIG